MLETASALAQIKDKTIILTGAFKPEKFHDSDAEFNLGSAIGAIDAIKNGIYIAMNGRIYGWDKCRRDKQGKFVEK